MILFINPEKARLNYLKLKEALPNAIIAYAIKANYDKKILSALAKEGCAAEVCSDYEHIIAKKAGFKRIIRNGFGKLRAAWLTNVEDVNAPVMGMKGARLHLNEKSKMGIDEKELLKHKWDCIAFHTRDGFKEALKKAENIAAKTGAGFIDVGGGINEERIKLLKGKENIIVEPGRYLVEDACEVVSKVLAVKGDKIIIDCGMNFLNKFSNSRFVVTAQGKKNRSYKVFGPIPTDIDNIGVHNLPELKAGDEVIIKNAGAYTLSMASAWTRPLPKIRYV